jgi:Amt family ammonium transporter
MSDGIANFVPEYASYNWTGAPADYTLATNARTGGDSRHENLNKWFQSGDTAFILISSCLVLIMVPGLGFLYSGLARRKSALSMMWACMAAGSIINFQWYFWGYSLTFSPTAQNGFIGDLVHFGLKRVLGNPSPGSPLVSSLLYSFYQMQFCAVTAAIVAGAVAERGRLMPFLVWTFLWATLVYNPIACWAWNANGWGYKYGVMDYAGGGPVEIGSGLSALAYSMVLGKRQEKMMLNFRPHNVSFILLGTILLWFGWLGFNGGSAFGANLRAVMACWNSNLAATFAAITWTLLDFRLARKWTMVGWCSGTISGLVAATPASGYIDTWGAVVLGIVTGFVCNFATKIKYWIKIDDSMDVFAEHGIAGMIGLMWNALFGVDYVVGLDGVNTGSSNPTTGTGIGGWPIGNYRQFYIQLAYIVACTGYAFVMSAILAYIVNFIPGLHLRASEEAELLGMDDDQLGEFAYDYVEVRRDYLAWTPQRTDQYGADPDMPQEDRHGIGEHSKMIKEGSHDNASAFSGPSAGGLPTQGDRHGVAAEEQEKEKNLENHH